MLLKVLAQEFTVAKIETLQEVKLDDEFVFIGKTDEELSLVCQTVSMPTQWIEREDGWRAMRIEGVLDFSLVGILAKLAGILAEESISIFALSTYNTDYILFKEEELEDVERVLKKSGYKFA